MLERFRVSTELEREFCRLFERFEAEFALLFRSCLVGDDLGEGSERYVRSISLR